MASSRAADVDRPAGRPTRGIRQVSARFRARPITLSDQRPQVMALWRPVTEAHEAIRNLLGRYCELMDAGDWPGLADLLRHAVLTDFDGHEAARGYEGVLAMYRDGTLTYEGSPRTRHLTTNSVIEVDEPTGAAVA